uniref:Uncharacterized protein n=1 Tax=Rhizophora mucronata TaxID=61149 RepID=A0A2P2MYA0_RHIMU
MLLGFNIFYPINRASHTNLLRPCLMVWQILNSLLDHPSTKPINSPIISFHTRLQ